MPCWGSHLQCLGHLQWVLCGWQGGAGGHRGSPGLNHCLCRPLQVCLFFQNQLFRGNRVTKVDSRRFAAFCSPNLPPLAVVGTDVTSKPGREQGQRTRAPALGFVQRARAGKLCLGLRSIPPNWERAQHFVLPWAAKSGAAPRGWPAWATKVGGVSQQVAPAQALGIGPEEEQVWGTCPSCVPTPSPPSHVTLSPGVPLCDRL